MRRVITISSPLAAKAKAVNHFRYLDSLSLLQRDANFRDRRCLHFQPLYHLKFIIKQKWRMSAVARLALALGKFHRAQLRLYAVAMKLFSPLWDCRGCKAFCSIIRICRVRARCLSMFCIALLLENYSRQVLSPGSEARHLRACLHLGRKNNFTG